MAAGVPLRLLLLFYYIFSWLAIKQPGSSGAVLGQRLPEWAGWAKFPASLRRSGTQGASAPSPFSSLLLRVRSGRFKDSVQATPFLAPSYSLTFSSSVTRSPLWSLVLRGSVELCALFFGASALFFSFLSSSASLRASGSQGCPCSPCFFSSVCGRFGRSALGGFFRPSFRCMFMKDPSPC